MGEKYLALEDRVLATCLPRGIMEQMKKTQNHETIWRLPKISEH